jgi:hypothetical protein
MGAQIPWHFTTWLDMLDHRQTGIAGVLALLAGFGTVAATMIIARRQVAASDRVIAATREQTATAVRLERERVLSEVDALRKSLAVELRLQIARALGVHSSLRNLLIRPDRPITARMVESLSRMPAPIIYSANAGKIGFLEGDAMDVVMVYTLLEGARDGADRLATTYRPRTTSTRLLSNRRPKSFWRHASGREAFCRDCGPGTLRMTLKTRH